ncbi:proteasome subunit beta type-2-like [Phymastichus coffea]|uniref:proteasome subunit beta type-2-like n=1 Tax=Phymastichus coffea TaxID=108790 RepID=UPI00273CB89B|nr:proteasome subunit beta type-2-like [Phymastichus coffea]
MECLIGIQFKDFVLIAADMTNATSIMVMKNDEHKIFKISNKLVMAVSGESGDAIQFSEYINKNLQLYKMRNGYELSPKAAANFTRRNLADYLRSRTPYFVNMLMAGYDDQTGPELYFIDYLASCVRVPYATHGYGGFFSLTILDRYYKSSMTEDEAYILLKKCVSEVHKRLIINLPNFKVQKISKEGITELPPITAQNLAVEAVTKA